MIREVKLISHLPFYVQNYREIQGIMNAEDPEFQSVEDISEVIKDNMFILHTDESGIERYEKMFGLTPSKNDSLSKRQANVLAQYTNSVIYTLRGLKERLDIVCGVDNYTLELLPNQYEINIEVNLPVKDLLNTVISIVKDMIPANMICTCSTMFNTHNVLANYPNYLLMQFTHDELYNSLTINNISATCDNISNYTVESLESVSCENVVNYGMRKV